MSEAIKNRYDFVFLFDVKDGNPNGDPDQVNLPRADAEDQRGLVTDVCIKRKVRNYVMLEKELKVPFDIFIRQEQVLNRVIDSAAGDTIRSRQVNLSEKYFDIRTFGAVLSTGEKGAGTIRGPVQFTFSRSEDRIFQAEHSITRCAVTTVEEEKNRKAGSTLQHSDERQRFRMLSIECMDLFRPLMPQKPSFLTKTLNYYGSP